MTEPDESQRLSARFLAGDRSRVDEVHAAVTSVVRAFRLGHDVEQDLVQEALARLVACLQDGRFRGKSSLKTYAQSVAKFTCLEFRRSRRHPIAVDPDTVASSAAWSEPEGTLLKQEEHRCNLEAYASLPADCRQLLALVFIEGLTYREIGFRLGITEGAIKSRVRRMRLFCRRMLAGRSLGSPRRQHAGSEAGK